MTLAQFKQAEKVVAELEPIKAGIVALEALSPSDSDKALVRTNKFSFEIPARLLYAQAQQQLVILRQKESQLVQELANI